MEKHLKFKLGQQREFVNKVLEHSGLTTDQLARLVSISPRNFRDWKNEKYNISKSAVEKMSKEFNVTVYEKLEVLENRWVKYKSQKGKAGGFMYKLMYGNPATPEGRKKGGKHTLEILRKRGVIPPINIFKCPKNSKKLAEFIGIALGDGGITSLQIQITLNSIKDSEYSLFVHNLCFGLFGTRPKMFKRKNCNANVIYYNGINLIEFLKKKGLKVGNKVKLQVDVPGWIVSSKNYSTACLRGLMDTDGGIFVHKYKVNGKIYKYNKLCFSNHSIPLLNFVYTTLKELGLNPKIISQENIVNKKVWLYNTSEVNRYLKLVGSSNHRLFRYKLAQGG